MKTKGKKTKLHSKIHSHTTHINVLQHINPLYIFGFKLTVFTQRLESNGDCKCTKAKEGTEKV